MFTLAVIYFVSFIDTFFTFSRHFAQSSQKMRKKSVFEFFARRSAKIVRKQCYFTFRFRDTFTKFAKNAKKQRFLRFLRDVPQKVWENSVFPRFSIHFVQSSQKMQKKTAFLSFLRDVPQKVWENSVFSRFSRHFAQSSQINAKKTVFFKLFARRPAKSLRKQCFFHVFRDSLYKVRKKCEKQRFLSFLREVP